MCGLPGLTTNSTTLWELFVFILDLGSCVFLPLKWLTAFGLEVDSDYRNLEGRNVVIQ